MKKLITKKNQPAAVVERFIHDDFVPRTRKASQKKSARPQRKSSEANDVERLRQIYRAAAWLFCEKGYEATSMSDIAERVGITKAGVYHFIKGTKQELLFEIISFGLDRLDVTVVEPARALTDAEARLRFIITSHVGLIISGSTSEGYNPVTIVVEEVSGLSPKQLQTVNQRKRGYVELIRDTLKDLQAEGKLKDVNPTVTAFSILGTILWVARWYRASGSLTAETVAAEITKIICGGMLVEKKDRTRERGKERKKKS
ncbi:MAG: TetR/AcrR family transcriptional regulator [Blastocatellia bacterium]